MKKFNVFLIATLASLFSFLANMPVYMGSDSLKEELKSVTVSLFSVGDGSLGSCSGTIVNEVKGDYHVLTAKHCISRTDEFYADDNEVKLIISPAEHDLAYLILDGKVKDKKPAQLARFNASKDEKIHFVGYPSEQLYISSGFVYRVAKNDSYAFMTNRGGCSGGGLFDEQSRLIGVLWGGYPTHLEHVSIYESVRKIRHFLGDIEEELNIYYVERDNKFENILNEETEESIEVE